MHAIRFGHLEELSLSQKGGIRSQLIKSVSHRGRF